MLLTIPKRHKPALERLLNLPASGMRSLIEGLRNAKPAGSLFDFTHDVAEKGKTGLGFDELSRILGMLTSLYRLRIDQDLEMDEFISELIKAAQGEGILRVDNGNLEQLQASLSSIFESDNSLGLTAKISELRTEHERTLCPYSCRILTDLRPVFGNDVAQKPIAAVLQHMLKLTYHEGDERKDFFVALDSDDVRILQDLLERAVAKEGTLAKMVQSDVPILGSVEDAEI
jgi:hypothetical protein